MTTHLRQQIREEVAAGLTGLTTTGPRVFLSRMRPATDAQVPCLLITTDQEDIETNMTGLQARELALTVRGVHRSATALDTTLDAMALEVETAMESVVGTVTNKVPGGFGLRRIDIEYDDSGDKPVGVVSLEFRGTYFTKSGAPGTAV